MAVSYGPYPFAVSFTSIKGDPSLEKAYQFNQKPIQQTNDMSISPPPPPDFPPPAHTAGAEIPEAQEGWAAYNTEIDGTQYWYFVKMETGETAWELPNTHEFEEEEEEEENTTNSRGLFSRKKKKKKPQKLAKWEQRQNHFIAKYYDKAASPLSPGKLADDPRYNHITTKK